MLFETRVKSVSLMSYPGRPANDSQEDIDPRMNTDEHGWNAITNSMDESRTHGASAEPGAEIAKVQSVPVAEVVRLQSARDDSKVAKRGIVPAHTLSSGLEIPNRLRIDEVKTSLALASAASPELSSGGCALRR
jgi:hypothetical protein